MAITGTQIKSSGGSIKNYFINKVTIEEAELAESNYTDCSIRLAMVDGNSGYKYTLYINQNFEKDIAGAVTGLKFPDDLNRLYLSTDTDMNVTDAGVPNLDVLVGNDIAIINYVSNGKYKRNTWRCVGSVDKTNELGKEFEAQAKKGYPKDFVRPEESSNNMSYAEKVLSEGVKAPSTTNDDDSLPF